MNTKPTSKQPATRRCHRFISGGMIVKCLNLYAGIGGNRELWTGCEVKDMTESHVRNVLRLLIRKLESGELRFVTFEEQIGCDATEADLY